MGTGTELVPFLDKGTERNEVPKNSERDSSLHELHKLRFPCGIVGWTLQFSKNGLVNTISELEWRLVNQFVLESGWSLSQEDA